MEHMSTAQSEAGVWMVGRGPRTPGFPSPDQIRASIQELVSENEIDQAQQLAEEGLEAYPDSEGVLAISGLLAMVRNDWSTAERLLGHLLDVQGERASDYARMMYERAKQCCPESSSAPVTEP